MYIKTIKRSGKEYKYYYHNIKQKGKVKNIFLSSNKQEALAKLKELKNEHFEFKKEIPKNNFQALLDSAPSPSIPFEKSATTPSYSLPLITLFLVFGIGLGILYFIIQPSITGFVIYSSDIITLQVNNNVSQDALIFLSIAGQEYNKSINEFNLIPVNNIYEITNLDIALNSFNLSLNPGTYTFVASLIDNNTLIAITSQDITVSEEVIEPLPIPEPLPIINETNITPIIPEPEINITLPENVTLPEPEIIVNITEFELPRVENKVEEELNVKEKVRVILIEKQESESNINELINEAEQNVITKKVKLVRKGDKLAELEAKIENNTFDLNDLADLQDLVQKELEKEQVARGVTQVDVVQLTDKASKIKEILNKTEVIEIEQDVDNVKAVVITKDELEEIKKSNLFSEVLLDREVNLFTDKAINITNVKVVQQLGYSGLGKSICFLDTGINYNVFNLSLNSTVFGKDFVNQDDDPLDDHGHGTSVANVLLKTAPNAKIYAAKVINSNGIGYESDVLAGLQYCINNNVNVISFSIGSSLSNGFCDSNLVANKSNNAVEQGIYVVAATGNDNLNNEIRVPACASKVTRVASSSKQDNISSFSNIFLNDLLAPGENLNNIGLNGENIISSGTSFSAPLVAGGATLLLQNISLSPNELTYRLRSTAEIINFNNISYERINLYNALINNFTHIPFDYNANVSQIEVPSGEFFGFANPSFNTPTLNTTDVRTNNTNVNITLSIVHNDNTGLYNITNWYENNQSLLVLNMPFVTNNTDVKDYSGFNNNGTISGALWQRYLNEDNNSLVLLMPFDEDNSTTAIDSSDYKNNGVLTNGVVLNTTNCVTGTCYSFDGVNDQINSSYSESLNLSGKSFTIETWVKLQQTGSPNDYILTRRAVNDDYTVIYGFVANKYELFSDSYSGANPRTALTTSITDNNWHYIVWVYNISTVIGYLDGNQDVSSAKSFNFSGRNSNLYFGTTGTGNFFNGSIDNVRIYNKALTSNEIQDHYEKYKLYYSPSFKFDGVNDFISVTNSNSVDMVTNSFTLEGWINSKGSGQDQWVIAKMIGSLSSNGYRMRLKSTDNKLSLQLMNGTTQATDVQTIDSTAAINLNSWNHFTVTIDKNNNQVKFYINGNLDSTTALTTRGNYSNTENLVIGDFTAGGGQGFNGSISSVRIYNRSLSANQIYELYNSYNTSALNKLVSEETTTGRTYKAQVYVANSSDIGVSDNTTELLILSEYLTFTNSPIINSTNGLNTTEQDLTVFFTPNGQGSTNLNYSIEVFKNNASSFNIGNITATDNIFTRFVINNANTTKGETFKAQVRLSDGVGFSSYTNTSEILILNYVPNITFSLINSTDVLTNNTNVNLTLKINTTDFDTDTVFNFTGTWYENNNSLLVLNMPFVTNNTDVKDYSGFNNNGTISGALWQRYLNEDNNSLVLLMPFDRDNSSTAIDSSDYKNNGVLGNITQNTQPNITTDCPTGKCYTFDGINDFINVTASTTLQITTNASTFEAWIKTDINFQQTIFNYDSFSPRLTINGDILEIYWDSAFYSTDQNITTDNKWHYISVVFDNGQVKYYKDGIFRDNVTIPSKTSATDLTIGMKVPGGSDIFFNGSIDNVRIYNKALTASEIKDHYEKYKLYYSPSFKFDGVNDFINVTNTTLLVVGSSSWSAEAWIFNKNGRSTGYIVSTRPLDSGETATPGYVMGMANGDGRIYWQISDGVGSTTSDCVTSSLNNNTWYHLVGVRDTNTDTVRLYLDGVQACSVTDNTGSINANGQSVKIGSHYTTGGVNFWNGSITQVRIYNRSLSANQIYELYNSYNTSALNKLVDSETTAGNTYKASLYASDTYSDSNQVNTSELLIQGTYLSFTNAPVINSTNAQNTTNEDLNVYFTPDNLGLSNINYSIEVFKNNASQFILANIPTTANVFTNFIINNLNTSKGQTWKAQVWLTDSISNSTLVNTSELLILNYIPNITYNFINSTDVRTNNTNVNLTLFINVTDYDNDIVANITNWYENNQSILVLNMPFVTNNTDVKDYSGFNNNGTISGALWQRYLNEDNNSLVLLMPFDEDNSSTAIDSSDYKNNGVLSGVTLSSDCPTGKCYTFDGDKNSINFSNAGQLNITGTQITIEVWIYPRNMSGIQFGDGNNKVIISKRSVNDGYILDAGGCEQSGCNLERRVRFQINAQYELSLDTIIPKNNWTHITAVYNGSRSLIYLNGALDKTGTVYVDTINYSNIKATIGRLSWSDAPSGVFNGSIDNVRIYNKALTSNEIQDHYEKYKLYYQPSFKFDGVNNRRINITHSSSLNTSKQITIEAWIYPVNLSPNYFVSKYFGSGNREGYALSTSATNKLIFEYDTIGVSSYQAVTSNSIIKENQWQHIAVTVNTDTNNINIYINGTLDKAQTTAINDLEIGTEPFYTGSFRGTTSTFNGSIANVRIYNRSLSANQIYELYNSYNTSALNKLVSQELKNSTTYKASVWASDTFTDSQQVNTSEILILAIPSFSTGYPQINSTDGSNQTTRNLRVMFIAADNDPGDVLRYDITFFTNNLTNFTLRNLAYTNNILQTEVLQSRNLTKGQTWKAMINLSDGSNNVFSNTSELLIANTPPAFQVAPVINSTNGLNVSTVNLNVFFTPNETDVNDLNLLTYLIQTFTNNVTNFTINSISTSNGTFTNFIIQSRNLTKGQTWKAMIRISDGTGNSDYFNTTELLILNTIPAFDGGYPQINSTDGTNQTTKNLRVMFKANDTDVNDVLRYDIQIFTNNLTNFTLRNIAYTNGTMQVETLQSANLTKGQTWKAQINLSDGTSNIFANTSELLILNTAPAFQVNPNINSTDTTNRTTINLNVYFTPNETDVADLSNLNYSIQVFTNNISNFSIFRISTTNGTFTNFVINSRNLTKGQTWKAMIWVGDGSDNSTYQNTSELLILNTVPSTPTNLQPANNTKIITLTPNINWTNSTDLDNDPLFYELEIATDPSNFTKFMNYTSFGSNVTGTPGLIGGFDAKRAADLSNINLRGITTNGSDFWVVSEVSQYVYHFNAFGENITGTPGLVGGFSVKSAYSSINPFGITTNGSDFWITDQGGGYIYHFNSTGGNVTGTPGLIGGFSEKSATSTVAPYGITTNGSNFWVADNSIDWIYQFDAYGNNVSTGGINPTKAYSTAVNVLDVATNGSDFWLADDNTNFIYHFNAFGENMSDGFDTGKAWSSSSFVPSGIDTDARLNPGTVNDFWIVDVDQADYIYHFALRIKEQGIDGNTTNHKVATNLNESTNYYYRVRVYDGSSFSDYVYGNFTTHDIPQFTTGYPQINSTDGTNLTTRNLRVSFVATDNEAGDVLRYNITYFTNNLTNFTLENIAYTNGTMQVETLQSRNFTKGQTWKAMISLTDNETRIYANTSELLILNTPPAFDGGYPQINSTDGTNQTTKNLRVMFKANDTDVNDVLRYDIQIFTNNLTNFTLRNIAYTNGTMQVETLQSANLTKGQTWKAQINLSDGSSNIFSNTSELLILNTNPGFFTLPIINSTNALNTTEQNLNVFFTPNETDVNDVLTYDIIVMMNNITNYTLTNLATTNGTLTIHTIQSTNTTKGQTWRGEIRISDGTGNSGYMNTTEILILNNASTITQPAFNQTSFKVEENINVSLLVTDIDLDLSNVTFEWFKNNALIRRTTNNNLANNTNTSDMLARYNYAKSDTIIVQAFAFDGTSNSTLINSTTLTISNSAPTFLVNPTINSTDNSKRATINLQVTFTANDTNADSLTYSIQYFTNNRSNFTLTSISANRNVITVHTLQFQNLTEGQTWHAQVQLSDGTDTSAYVNTSELLILNTNPGFLINPVINSTDATNRTTINLNVYFTPNETDVQDVLTYGIQVFTNNRTNFTINSISTTNGTFTNFIINSRNLTKGQTWHAQVWIYDGGENSTLVNTSELLIVNTPPAFQVNPVINSTNGLNTTLQDLNIFFTPNETDIVDLNSLTYSIQVFTNNRTNFTISSISTTNGTFTNFIINNSNTSRTQTWRAQVRISDGAGYSNYVNTSEILILNIIPNIPTLQLPQNGTWRHNNRWQLFDNNTLFLWNTTDDDPEDTLTYELQVSNITLSERSYRDEFLFRNISLSRTRENITIEEIATNFTIAEHIWRVRAYDNTDYSNWSQNNTFEIVYAVINITSPKEDIIFEILTSQTIRANELANPGWINNATIKFIGDTVNAGLNFTMSNTTNTTNTNYTHSYSVPDVSSRFITIAVYGNNASLSANDTLRVRITKPLSVSIINPQIVSIITDPSTVQVNTSLNITVNSDLSVLLDTINVTYRALNGSTVKLAVTTHNEDNFSENNYDYQHNYSFTPIEIGQYVISVYVKDVNNPNSDEVNRNTTITSSNLESINLTGVSIHALKLKDVSSKRVIASGVNITQQLPAGPYDLESNTTRLTFTLHNMTVNATLQSNITCRFNDISESVSVPSDTRAVDQFELECNQTFASVNLTYNYTSVLSSITHETNLKIYKCAAQASCNFSKLTTAIDTTNNTLTAHFTTFSVFMLSEDTVTTTVTIAGAPGGGGGGGGVRPANLEILDPGPLSLYSEDTIIAPIIVRNTGVTTLFGISLSATTNSTDLSLEFDQSYIERLETNEQRTVILRIISHTDPGNYEIIIRAEATAPAITDTAKIIVSIIEKGAETRAEALKQINFATKLFEGNPECLELKELLNQAQKALELKQYDKALTLADSAIQSCKNLIALQQKELKLPKKPTPISDVLILSLETLLFLFISYGLYSYYKRRRIRKLAGIKV